MATIGSPSAEGELFVIRSLIPIPHHRSGRMELTLQPNHESLLTDQRRTNELTRYPTPRTPRH